MRGRRAAVLLVAVGLMPGCLMGRTYLDRPISEENVARIRRGATTKKEILAWFGPPQEIDARRQLDNRDRLVILFDFPGVVRGFASEQQVSDMPLL